MKSHARVVNGFRERVRRRERNRFTGLLSASARRASKRHSHAKAGGHSTLIRSARFTPTEYDAAGTSGYWRERHPQLSETTSPRLPARQAHSYNSVVESRQSQEGFTTERRRRGVSRAQGAKGRRHRRGLDSERPKHSRRLPPAQSNARESRGLQEHF